MKFVTESRKHEWTGKSPQAGVCPGVNTDGIIRSLPLPNLNNCSRQDVLDYFDNSWALTEVLFSALQNEEAFYRAPIHNLRHPLIFYYGHPAVLYINKARVAGLILDGIHPYFEQLFETGVDEMSWDDLSKNEMQWPEIAEVTAYRANVYRTIRNIIETHADFDNLPVTKKHPLWAIFMGFEHERIHLETSSVLIRELPAHLVKKPAAWPDYFPLTSEKNFPENSFVDVASGNVQIGKPHDFPSYGWDNEYGQLDLSVDAFRATEFLVSNGEFLQFVKEGGYQDARFWSEEGWQWRTFRNAKRPSFWVPAGPAGLHDYQLRLCFDVVPMQYAWPVDVNFHEAKAYANWRSERDQCDIPYRVMTEAEHHRLRDEKSDDEVMCYSGHDMQMRKVNLNLAYGSQTPVNFSGRSAAGFADVFGNAWEWCEDHFAPLPGFEVHSFYDDFSSPCFDGKHNILMGGSFISTGDEASRWARFHFRRHFFQHAGFRLVQPLQVAAQVKTTCLDAPPPYVNSKSCCSTQKNGAHDDKYETQQLLNQYLLLHFGEAQNTWSYGKLPEHALEFPKRCAQLLCAKMQEHHIPSHRVLDLGCAVGGASFELARQFAQVTGIDLSHSFIEAANKIKETGKVQFVRKEEGNLFTNWQQALDAAIARERVDFRVADACALPADLGTFDAVLMANLLCRLPSPKACLSRLMGTLGLLKSGGLLMMASPYSWLHEFTPESAWLSDKSTSSIEGLHALLDDHFKLVYEDNMPLIIREHARKFEYIIAHTTIWIKY